MQPEVTDLVGFNAEKKIAEDILQGNADLARVKDNFLK